MERTWDVGDSIAARNLSEQAARSNGNTPSIPDFALSTAAENRPDPWLHSRQRAFFESQELAQNYASILRLQREDFSGRALAISPALVETPIEAQAMLNPLGITILGTAHMVAKHKRRAEASHSRSLKLLNHSAKED